MSKLQALREKRATQAKSIRALADKMNADGYVASAEDDTNWAAVNADYNANLKLLEREEITTRIEGEAASANERIAPFVADPVRAKGGDGAELANNDTTRTLAIQGWLKAYSSAGINDQQAAACRAVGLNPFSKEIGFGLYSTEDYRRLQGIARNSHPNNALDRMADFKAMGTGNPTAGGYLIAPETLRTQLEINMLAYGGVRQVAETIRTASGEPLSWPTADDTTNTGVQLGEGITIGSTSVDPSLAKVFWSAYKFSSKVIFVPYELLQDSVFNLPSLLGQMLGERLGRITNTKFTTGTGAATCKGIVTCATAFSASTTAIVADDLIALQHAIDPAYRTGGSFMMHDSIVLAIRKLKDGQSQYLWQSGLRDNVPDRLLGWGITINQDMDSTTASGKKSVLGGQLSKYKIRTVGDVRMYRLEERYRDTDQDGFIAFTREDGNLLTAGTAPVKYLAH